MSVTFNATVEMRAYYSAHHLWAAKRFAYLADKVEDSDAVDCRLLNRSYVTNAVLASAAFLEAAINEVFDDAKAGEDFYIGPLAPDAKECLRDGWPDQDARDNKPTLWKYRKAIMCAKALAFDLAGEPYRDAYLVTELRNRLTHARLKSRVTETADKLETELMNKFAPNRLMERMANPYYPERLLGVACARWAAASAESFADEFFKRIGVCPYYQRRRTDFTDPAPGDALR